MAGFNPRQLIQRARLSVGDGAIRGGKRPQQTSLRRAISDSYYALFHRACTEIADHLIGATPAYRGSVEYRLIYRSVQHHGVRDCCRAITNVTTAKPPATAQPSRYAPFLGATGPEIQNFARSFLRLQADRHRADYDPLETFSLTVTRVIIDIAEAAITDFDHAPAADRKSFVLLSLFEPRA